MPTHSRIAENSTVKLVHVRIIRDHRGPDQAVLFHNYMGALPS